VLRRDPGEYDRIGNVPTSLEQRGPQGEAERLPRRQVPLVGNGSEGEGGERAVRKRRGPEGVEEVGGDLAPELAALVSDELSVEGRPVDELQRPGSHVQPGLLTARLPAAVDETAKAHVGERAVHVREHLDRGQADSSVDSQPGLIVARERY
jgi:hypothetical protein